MTPSPTIRSIKGREAGMDVEAFEHALGGREFTVLSVGGQLAGVLGELNEVPAVEVQIVSTKAAATSLIRDRHYNLLVVEEDDDWDDVLELLESARTGAVDSIIVKGRGTYEIDHLRALLAGADAYVPRETQSWRVVPRFTSSELPRDRLARQLRKRLSPFSTETSDAVLEQLRGQIVEAATPDLAGTVVRAAKEVDEAHGSEIAEVTLPQIQQLLKETAKGVGAAEPEASLYWNVRFPDDAGILRNAPHVVSAGGEYPFETALQGIQGIEGYTSPLPRAELEGRMIAYELAATNGMFRVDGLDGWDGVAISGSLECGADGTPPFRVAFRPSDAGDAAIQALLLVDGGSIARQVIKLTVVGTDLPRPHRRRSERASVPIPATAIADRANADLRLTLTPQTASLAVNNELRSTVTWLDRLPDQVAPACRQAYSLLGNLSRRFAPAQGLALVGQGGANSMVELARIGNLLHRRVFENWIVGLAPPGLSELAERIRRNGDSADPPQLQLVAPDYPVPWGLVYDQPVPENATPEDIDPHAFWGVRYDIYRDVVASEMPASRGTRCLIKPIVGKNVPFADQQLAFLKDLASRPRDDDSKVLEPSTSQKEIREWAKSGAASDLLYLYCHALPTNDFLTEDPRGSSSLGFGATEEDPPHVTLRQLRTWWNEPRRSHPVVILNACKSGNSDAVLGAPFVEFFTGAWSAQAFIGTDWPVAAALAHVMGQALLHEIRDERRSLRAALRSVVNSAAKENNFFPLMYAIYGSNNVRFSPAGQSDQETT